VTPCDLNNIFVSDPDPLHFVALAEKEGFPTNMCNWVKGLYGVVRESRIDTVVTVLEGDCSNTRALAEILDYRGVRTVPFSFPYDREREGLEREIAKFMRAFGVDEGRLPEIEREVRAVRESLAHRPYDLGERLVTGMENNLWQLCASTWRATLHTTARGRGRHRGGAGPQTPRRHPRGVRRRAAHLPGPARIRGGPGLPHHL
jgi:hypothetical protein